MGGPTTFARRPKGALAAPATIRRAHAVHPISALQTEYSLWTRDPEAELLDLTDELGITFVAYSPMGRGFLTGKIQSVDDLAEDDFRRHNDRFQGENFQKNLDLVAEVKELAASRGVTPAQLALGWILAKAEHTVSIPGTRSTQRLEENAAAADMAISEDELDALDAGFPMGAAAGLRYPEASMRALNG